MGFRRGMNSIIKIVKTGFISNENGGRFYFSIFLKIAIIPKDNARIISNE